MRRVIKTLGVMQEIIGSETLPRQWIATASCSRPEINPPRGLVSIYAAQRLTPELMGDRRKFNDDEFRVGRMYYKRLLSIGPATSEALLKSLESILEFGAIEESSA